MKRPVAVDFDAVLGDTKPLFRAWLVDARRRYRVELPDDAGETALDEALGNWRPLLERYAEEHARVYLRPDPGANAVVRDLAAQGAQIGAFTESPEPLAGVAASHLGVARRLDVLAAGPDALHRLLDVLGPDAVVVQTVAELQAAYDPSR